MIDTPAIPGTEEVNGVLNYSDYKNRFPIIKKLYEAIKEYDAAPLLYVPTDRTTIDPAVRYKQGNVPIDWAGSWRHITDLYRSNGLRQTIIELANFYHKQIEDKHEPFQLPEESFWSNPDYKYSEYVVTRLPWRQSFDTLTEDTRQTLLNIESWLERAMTEYELLNDEDIKKIEEAQANARLLSRPLSSLTGFEFLQLLKMAKV